MNETDPLTALTTLKDFCANMEKKNRNLHIPEPQDTGMEQDGEAIHFVSTVYAKSVEPCDRQLYKPREEEHLAMEIKSGETAMQHSFDKSIMTKKLNC